MAKSEQGQDILGSAQLDVCDLCPLSTAAAHDEELCFMVLQKYRSLEGSYADLLTLASTTDSLSIVKLILEQYPLELFRSQKNPFNLSAEHAVAAGSLSVVKYLLGTGLITPPYSMLVLKAIQNKREAVARLFIRYLRRLEWHHQEEINTLVHHADENGLHELAEDLQSLSMVLSTKQDALRDLAGEHCGLPTAQSDSAQDTVMDLENSISGPVPAKLQTAACVPEVAEDPFQLYGKSIAADFMNPSDLYAVMPQESLSLYESPLLATRHPNHHFQDVP